MNESDSNETVETSETVELIEGGRWYAIRTFTGHEEKVKVGIETEAKRLNLSNRILEVVIPKETVYEVRAGKRKTREKNFLPGYILVRCIMDAKLKEIIQNLPNTIATDRGRAHFW